MNDEQTGTDTQRVHIAVSGIGSDTVDLQAYWNPDNHVVAKGTDGYYYMAETDGICRIMYFDDSTKKAIPLCAKPECTHEDNTCNAYLMDMQKPSMENFLTQTIYYYNGYIYVVKCEAGMAKLVQISADGGERRPVGDLFANSGVSSISFVFHENYVYAYDDTGHSGQTEEAEETIKKISLENGTGETVFSYKGTGASIIRGRSFGRKLYFVVREYQKDKETHAQKIEYKGLYTYDYDSGEAVKVIDANICDYYVDTENQRIFYFIDGEGLYRYSLEQGSNELIYGAHDELLTCRMSYDGQYIYLYNGGSGSLTDAKSRVKPRCYVIDADGNEINSVLCNGMVYFGDEKYIFEANGDNIEYIEKEHITEAAEWSALNSVQ